MTKKQIIRASVAGGALLIAFVLLIVNFSSGKNPQAVTSRTFSVDNLGEDRLVKRRTELAYWLSVPANTSQYPEATAANQASLEEIDAELRSRGIDPEAASAALN